MFLSSETCAATQKAVMPLEMTFEKLNFNVKQFKIKCLSVNKALVNLNDP